MIGPPGRAATFLDVLDEPDALEDGYTYIC